MPPAFKGVTKAFAAAGKAAQEASYSEEGRASLRHALPEIVGMLNCKEAAESAAIALRNLAFDDGFEDAIREAGGIEPLVALLSAGASSKAANNAALALCYIACSSSTNKDAICDAGGIQPLVALLSSAGIDSDATPEDVTRALRDADPLNIHEAGLSPLAAMLSVGVGSKAARAAEQGSHKSTKTTKRGAVQQSGQGQPWQGERWRNPGV